MGHDQIDFVFISTSILATQKLYIKRIISSLKIYESFYYKSNPNTVNLKIETNNINQIYNNLIHTPCEKKTSNNNVNRS